MRPTRLLTDGYRIFNVHTNLGACGTHEGGSGTNQSAQELYPRDRKTVAHSALPELMENESILISCGVSSVYGLHRMDC